MRALPIVLAAAVVLILPSTANAVPTVRTHVTVTSPVALTDPLVPLGDVNGDGLEDLGAAESAWCARRAWVVFGTATPGTVDLSSVGTRSLALTGLGTGLCGNLEMAPAGDVNGDGRDDIVIRTVIGGNELFRVIYGRPGGGALDVGTPGTNGWLIRCDSTEVDVETIRGVGDVDGDGRDDLGVEMDDLTVSAGVWGADGAILYGRGGAQTVDLPAATGPAVRFASSLSGVNASVRILPFGDVTRDGRADVLTVAGTFPFAYALHAGRAPGATIDLDRLGGSSLALGTTSEIYPGRRPLLGDLDGDGLQDYAMNPEGRLSATLSSRLAAPLSDAKLAAGSLRFRATESLPGPRGLFSAGDVTGDGRGDIAAPATSGVVARGETGFLVERPAGRSWSFLVPGATAARDVDLEAPSGGTVRFDSMPSGFTAETGLRFAGGPAQLVAVRGDRREALVQRVVDAAAPADTSNPVISGVSLDNPTIWRSIPCGSEGGAACPGPRTSRLRFDVSEPVKLQAKLVNAAGATKLQASVWVNPGTHVLGLTAAYRYPDSSGSGWINTRLTPSTYRWVLDATDLAGRRAATATTPLVVTG